MIVMPKKIIFVHGRNIKPPERELRKLWYDAIRAGLKRDFGIIAAKAFTAVKKEFVYFGDLSNEFLHNQTGVVIPDEIESKRETLNQLKRYCAEDFNKKNYSKIAGDNALKEGLADTFSDTLSLFRLGASLISAAALDMGCYWDAGNYYGSNLRLRLGRVLQKAFDRNDKIMLVAHSFGSIVSYDTLWKFSHYGEYREKYGNSKKVELFVTLGSPLGDENVKAKLKGGGIVGSHRYPHNIKRWVNISAEDDFVSHDSRLMDDYKAMQKYNLLEAPVRDIYPIYNLAIRNGRAKPHTSLGYLIHPEFSEVLWGWLSE